MNSNLIAKASVSVNAPTGLPDKPENYHTVTIALSREADRTRVSLSQDNNPTEEAREHSTRNWETMLANLKKVVEE